MFLVRLDVYIVASRSRLCLYWISVQVGCLVVVLISGVFESQGRLSTFVVDFTARLSTSRLDDYSSRFAIPAETTRGKGGGEAGGGGDTKLFMLCGFVPTMSANLRRLVVRLSWHCRRGGLGQCRHLDVRFRICRVFRDRRRRCRVYPTAVSVLLPIPLSAFSPPVSTIRCRCRLVWLSSGGSTPRC